MRVRFACGDLQLEGELTSPAAPQQGAVICHPHPQYGGDMNNSVVLALARALDAAGYATLRFNFRGVGGSTGAYANAIGEVDDARAATRCLSERSGVQRVTLAGYSFGAMVILRAGPTLAAVDRLIAVAPPLAFFSLQELQECPKAKLFVVGDGDRYCSVAELSRQLQTVAEPKTQQIVPGADHFFLGHEATIARAVRAFVE